MSEIRNDLPLEIGAVQLDAWRRTGQPHLVLDVRENWETEICVLDGALAIPLALLPLRKPALPTDRPIAVMCHHGGRSLQATIWLRDNGFPQAVNVTGGIDGWARTIDPQMKTY